MARLQEMTLQEKGEKIPGALWKYVNGIDIYLPANDLFDISKEKDRVLKKMKETEQKMKGIEGRISNPSFLKNAPEAIIAKEKQIFEELEKELQSLQEKMKELDLLK
jgi:valyl-tRNA synthetase